MSLPNIYNFVQNQPGEADTDINNVLLCMKLCDNIHDFCKVRSNINFKRIEQILNNNKYIIKNSPSTIEENTPKQLAINTGLYEKIPPSDKHRIIEYKKITNKKIICDLLQREDNIANIILDEKNLNEIDEYSRFVNSEITDLSLSIPVVRNLDGKRIFSIDQVNTCKGIIYNFFFPDSSNIFNFILDAANISLKKIFYKSTFTSHISSRQITEETNKWDMASNILPDVHETYVDRIKSGKINSVIMFPEPMEGITIADISYDIDIVNIGIFEIVLKKPQTWDTLKFNNLIKMNENYYYALLNSEQYELRGKKELIDIGFNFSNIKSIPLLSDNITCYPVNLFEASNKKYYGAMVFIAANRNIVLIVSRAYRSKTEGDNLGVETLSGQITAILDAKKNEESIDLLTNHLFGSLPDPIKKKCKISFILDIKRVGDWAQIMQCYNNNYIIRSLNAELNKPEVQSSKPKTDEIVKLIKSYNNLIFISLDNLAISYSQLLNINYMHTKKSDSDVTFIMRRDKIPDTASAVNPIEVLISKSKTLDNQYALNFNMQFFDSCVGLLNRFQSEISNNTIEYNDIFNRYKFGVGEKGIHTHFPIIPIYITRFIFSLIKYLFTHHLVAIAKYGYEKDNEVSLFQSFEGRDDADSKAKLYAELKILINKKILLLEDILNISNSIKYNNTDINNFNTLFDGMIGRVKRDESLLNVFRLLLKKSNILRSKYDFSNAIISLIEYIDEIVKYKPTKRYSIEKYRPLIINICKKIAYICLNLNIIKIIHNSQFRSLLGKDSIIDILQFNEKIIPDRTLLLEDQMNMYNDDTYKEINFSKLIFDKLIDEKFIHEYDATEVIHKLQNYITDIIFIFEISSSSDFTINGDRFIFDRIPPVANYKDAANTEVQIFNFIKNEQNFNLEYRDLISSMSGGAPTSYTINGVPPVATDLKHVKLGQMGEPVHKHLNLNILPDIQPQPLTVLQEEEKKRIYLTKEIAKHIQNISNIKEFKFPQNITFDIIFAIYNQNSRLSFNRYSQLMYSDNTDINVLNNKNHVLMVSSFFVKVFQPSINKVKDLIYEEIYALHSNLFLGLFTIKEFINRICQHDTKFQKLGYNSLPIREKFADIVDDDNIDTNEKEFLKIYNLDFLFKLSMGYDVEIRPYLYEAHTRDNLFKEYFKLLYDKDFSDESFILEFGNLWHIHLTVFLKLIQIIKISKIVPNESQEREKQSINTHFEEKTAIYNVQPVEIIKKIRPEHITHYDQNLVFFAIKIQFGFVFLQIENIEQSNQFIIEVSGMFLRNFEMYSLQKLTPIRDITLYDDLYPILVKYYSEHSIVEIVSKSNIYRDTLEKGYPQDEYHPVIFNPSQLTDTTDTISKDVKQEIPTGLGGIAMGRKAEQLHQIHTKSGKKKILKGGLIQELKEVKEAKTDFICHVNFIEIYKQLRYLYNNFSQNEFVHFKALCYYYDISIPDDLELNMIDIVKYINKQFIERYYIFRQDMVYNTIFANLEKCEYDRFLEYLNLYMEIKKYSDIVKEIEKNIITSEDTADEAFKENIEQLYITCQSLDYFIERPIYSLYGEPLLLKCTSKQSFENIITKFSMYNETKYRKKLSHLYKFGIKANDIDKITNIKSSNETKQNEVNTNIQLIERFIEDYNY